MDQPKKSHGNLHRSTVPAKPPAVERNGYMDVKTSEIGAIPLEDLEKIWTWNKIPPQPIDRCVHEIVEEKAAAQRNSLAISSWDGEMRYGELDQVATKLARQLAKSGVGPGLLVPLCFEKSMWTTVAMLGVLKAGAGFVLLDPSLPEQRLQVIVQQVKAKLILCSVSNRALSSRLVVNVIAIHRQSLTDLDVQENQALPPISPSSVMCLNFTSGSTGFPKGAILTHRNYASALYHQAEHLGFTTQTRIYDFSSYSFDAPISHTFTALAAGACLCVPKEQDRKNKLAQSITSLRANVVALTPSVAQLLDPKECPTLQTLLFIGEPLRLRDINRWWGKVRVMNIYGPSECTPYSVINTNASCARDATRIGIGIGQVTWVVHPDNHNQLLPLGHTGELILEGPLVGEGYLNDPEKTAMAFIHDPVWLPLGAPEHPGRHGQRLYKTGDLVRYNEDGTLSFVGRKDTQVKIHGQRAELGEIEHCLQEHLPEAKHVVADIIMPEAQNPSPILAAFIQFHETEADAESEPDCIAKILPSPTNIEEMLAQSLPSYMVPTLFFSMRGIPQTVTGKLDRRRLREVGTFYFQQFMEKQKQMAKPVPPSRIGLELQKIMARILAIDHTLVGLDDNFFRLGGDSIAAMWAVSEAQKAGIELTVSDVFQYPTLGGLMNRCHLAVGDAPEEIPSYSLLGDTVDRNLLLREIKDHYQMDLGAVQDIYPCTPQQEALLSMTLSHPGEYVIQRILELRPGIEVRRFCRTWEEIVRNTAILRTRIVQCSGAGLLQAVLGEGIQWIHATGLYKYLEEDKKRPMDLGKPLARYALITDTAGVRQWFVWTLHHALYDGWSLPLMIDMVERAYCGKPITPQKQEFKAFIKYIRQQNNEDMAEYWHNTLADCDCTPFPALPPSVQRPVADSELSHHIPSLKARSRDVTSSTLIHAAWALLASCMTNSDDVVFGVVRSGRSAPVRGIAEIVGPTVATVPLRIKIVRSQKVVGYLAAVQRQATDMIPFEQFGLHRIAQTCPEVQQACMFQTLLVIQPDTNSQASDSLGQWQTGHEAEWANTFALTLEVQMSRKRIHARFDSNVIKSWKVKMLLGALEFVLRQLKSAGPEQSIAEIELVSPGDLDRIWNWNRIVPSPVKASIHHLIEQRVQEQPMAAAICSWDGQLTYGELDRLASKVAAQLTEFGVCPHLLGADILVPLCFEKTKWAVVSMLGVLKSGAGFVLLDPSLPEPRLQSIIEKVGATLLLCSQSNLDLGRKLSKTVIQVGPDLCEISRDRPTNPNPTRSTTTLRPSSRIMYAVFTSGSTGAPKGVLVSHENFCSAVEYQLELLGFTRESRVLDFASYAFDAAVHNSIATLVAGGCLCIPSEKDRMDNIHHVIATMRPTIANLTPTVARMVDPGVFHDLKTLILLGEPISAGDAKRWLSHKIRLINTYGPAECTPISTINVYTSTPEEAVLIGKGVGLVTWIVDPEDHNRLLPPGCTGELLLEGPLVGSGYMKDPQKTAEAFIESPRWLLDGSPGHLGRRGRLYKTGDLVQYSEDGSLAFMGRKDSQVKIRGQRFELEEVEYHITRCLPEKKSRVAAEIVVPEGDRNRSSALVAFIQVDEDGNGMNLDRKVFPPETRPYPYSADIKKKLDSQLPRYMVPTVSFSVPELPLTATGKTNRRKLRELGRTLLSSEDQRLFDMSEQRQGNGSPHSELISETEQPAYALAQKVHSLRPSWAQGNQSFEKQTPSHGHLALNDVLLHSSGLDSVNMMELMSYIAQNFGIRVGMQYLMDRNTSIRSLAEYITDSQACGARTGPRSHPSTQVDLMAEISRHDSRVLAVQQQLVNQGEIDNKNPPRGNEHSFTVLLTGASGFVGTQILRQLLEHRLVNRVICLVRGDTDDTARRRAINKATEALWWTKNHQSKLDVWRGDLSQPNLGVDPARWDFLNNGQEINVIIHNGASVHWTKSYQVLEAANVGSTTELLLLAVRHPQIQFLYVTGGRSWDCHEELDVAKELSVPDAIAYSQTKFVAEAVVRRAARRVPSETNCLNVTNPGWVIGTPTEGYSNPEDYIWRLAAACIRIAAYNAADADGWLSISDVTTTATRIIDTALGTGLEREAEKRPVNGMTWKEFWTILTDLGYRLQPRGMPEWLDLVRADIEAAREDHPLWPLTHMIEGLQNDERVAGRSLGKSGITPLRLKEAVRRSAQFLIGVGFLPTPTEEP